MAIWFHFKYFCDCQLLGRRANHTGGTRYSSPANWVYQVGGQDAPLWYSVFRDCQNTEMINTLLKLVAMCVYMYNLVAMCVYMYNILGMLLLLHLMECPAIKQRSVWSVQANVFQACTFPGRFRWPQGFTDSLAVSKWQNLNIHSA